MREKVTVLSYFFCRSEQAAQRFPATAHAIGETWRQCGELPTVISGVGGDIL